MLGASSSRSQESDGPSPILEVNDSVYQLYRPPGIPSIQVVFFHGLQLGPYRDAHWSSWKCGDGSCIWPQKWLVEEIPEAHVFSVSLNGFLANSSIESMDMYNLGENLISDLLMADIGQVSNCPVVLVGHSIGGLVIKELCCQAYRKLQESRDFERTKLEKFLNSMRGVFYYATPHHGSPAAGRLADKMGGALLKFFKTLSTETERLNSRFDAILKVYEKWQFAGLGEGRPTNLGWFGGEVMVGPEASARKDNFNVVEGADHFSICRPWNKSSRSFHKLKDFLIHIVDEMKVTVPVHEIYGLPKHPLDLERRALHVTDQLTGGAILGICGMGGIGKTTLAMQAFNIISKDFEYTCFVENVKGIPPHELQDRVLNHFHHNGKKTIQGSTQWSHLQNKKTLIALDDIDAENQLKVLPNLEHFAAGSCIIMTSRNKHVFKYYEGCILHEVQFLNDDDAKKLFCQHAFGPKDIPAFLVDNVNAVVTKCHGLPLTLEVIGKYLRDHGADDEVWIETLQRLRTARALTGDTDDQVWASLRISYDALLAEEQEMFTEAASIFFEQPLEYALAAWSSLTQTMQTTWENLVSKSLVKEINKRVWVHEHLRDLAQNISKDIMVSGCNDEANSAVDLLNGEQVEEGTKCVRLRYLPKFRETPRTLQFDSLSKLNGLKYMDLDGVSSEGSGKGLTRKISFLRFDGAHGFKLSKFKLNLNKMENLAVLQLSNFQIPEEFPEALGNLTNLRILSLSQLEGSVHLPENFGNLSRLRRLKLRNLRSLTLPKSFGNLLALEHLELYRIKSLALPESVGNLVRLATLHISFCYELAGLPNSFGSSLTSLEEVHIRWCPLIKCLPQSFSRLPGLQRLRIEHCARFEELGDAFGNLSSLRELYLDRVALERLPPSFSLLSGLELLHIKTAGQLRSLPDDFAQWTALKDLSISSKELETLPASFCCLKSLRQLQIHCPKLEMLPESLGELTLLEGLELVVDRVEILPLSVCNLYSLRDFMFTSSAAKLLPELLGQLSSLKTLHLDCPHLEKLPHTLGKLSSLEVLLISSSRLENLPESSVHLSCIKRLSLSSNHMEELPEILGKLSSLEELSLSLRLLHSLPESLGALNNLRKLSLKDAEKLKRLPDDFGELIKLQELEIHNAGELKTLPDNLSRLKSLRKLKLVCSKLERLPDNFGNLSSLRELSFESRSLKILPESGRQLKSLKKLTLTDTDNLKSEDFSQPIKLQELEIDNAGELQTLPDSFSRLKSLRKLKLVCSKLERLPDNFGNLSSLRELSIESRSLKILPESIRQLQSLKKLTLTDIDNLNSLPEDSGQLIKLQELEIHNAGELKTLPDSFSCLKSLQKLTLGCPKLERLPDNFGNLSSLEELSIRSRCLKILPESILQLQSLKKLTLTDADYLKSLPEDFGQLIELQVLEIDNAGELQTLPDSFSCLKSLQTLKLVCSKLERLPDNFGKLSSLEELSIRSRSLKSLPKSIRQLQSLKKLTLTDVDNLKSLPEDFGKLIKLQELEIDNAGELQTLPDSFSRLKSLQTLKLVCSKLERLPDNLGKLSSLERLSIRSRCLKILPKRVRQLQSLKKLTLTHADNLKSLPEDFGQLIKLQELEISDADELQTLPNSFPRLKSLQKLTLECSKLEMLPSNFGNLSSLEELSIRSRSLNSLPESIWQLQSLKKLTLKVGKSDRSLLDGIGKISSLNELKFDCCGHEETADLFEHFTSFAHELTLTGRDTQILPAGLGILSSLRVLSLKLLPLLKTLPDELGTLASLERLTISRCDMLESLPDSLGQVSSLKEVTLRFCSRLKTLPESLGVASLIEVALPQGDQSDELRLQAEESSQTKRTEAMHSLVYKCPLLDDSKMESLGWMPVAYTSLGKTSYQRKVPMGTV